MAASFFCGGDVTVLGIGPPSSRAKCRTRERLYIHGRSAKAFRGAAACFVLPVTAPEDLASYGRHLFFQPVAFQAKSVDPVEHSLQQGFGRTGGDPGPLQLQDFLAPAPELGAHSLDFAADGFKLQRIAPAPARSAGGPRRSGALPVRDGAADATN